MTLTQALALRPGQRVTMLHPEREVYSGRVIQNGRKVWIEWDDRGEQVFDHRYMHYIHILVNTRETSDAH